MDKSDYRILINGASMRHLENVTEEEARAETLATCRQNDFLSATLVKVVGTISVEYRWEKS